MHAAAARSAAESSSGSAVWAGSPDLFFRAPSDGVGFFCSRQNATTHELTISLRSLGLYSIREYYTLYILAQRGVEHYFKLYIYAGEMRRACI